MVNSNPPLQQILNPQYLYKIASDYDVADQELD
jgi:hypothetical protein